MICRLVKYVLYRIILFLVLFLSCCTNNQDFLNRKIFISRTGQIISYHIGDDGAQKMGANWNEKRFIHKGNGIIVDLFTGLMWERVPLYKGCNWEGAFKRINEMNSQMFGGYSDWRLPNINELQSLINFGESNQFEWLKKQGFDILETRRNNFWSSTTSTLIANSALGVNLYTGVINAFHKFEDSSNIILKHQIRRSYASIMFATNFHVYVIGVRTAVPGVIRLPKTGQTKKYHAGDDGDLQIGVPLPQPRFVDNHNGTITDKLTGLIWEKAPDTEKFTWVNAFTRIAKVRSQKLGGYSDWRLPNINELQSLNNYGSILSENMNANKFEGVQLSYYWSSTTKANDIKDAWLGMGNGYMIVGRKTDENCVIAVRSGE